MRKLEFNERLKFKELFKNPTSGIILASFYSDIGETWISQNNRSGIIFVENIIYIGGHIDKESTDFLMNLIFKKKLSQCYIIPQKSETMTYLDTYFNQPCYKNSIIKSERHLMEININNVNADFLMSLIEKLPDKYHLKPIDGELFNLAKRSDSYLSDFVRLFHNYSIFEKEGFGFFLLDGPEIIAGISSYARYKEGVEVQIAVKPEYRGQNLAKLLGARFLIECKNRGIYPWWDAANPASEHVAVTLGYVLKRVTPIFKYIGGVQ